jgi:hypothetical protein
MLARLIPLLLLVLTRDGVLHRYDGHHDTTAKIAGATAVAALADGRVAVLAGGRILVDGKPIPGRSDGARALAGGARLWVLGGSGIDEVDPKRGARTPLLMNAHAQLLTADGTAVFDEDQGTILESGTPNTWHVEGRPIAMAAGDGKIFVATKAGPLVEIDRASGKQRILPLGDWWGTLALAFGDHALYAVTVAGKLWRIDPVRNEKTIVAMDGWQGAIDLSVLR